VDTESAPLADTTLEVDDNYDSSHEPSYEMAHISSSSTEDLALPADNLVDEESIASTSNVRRTTRVYTTHKTTPPKYKEYSRGSV
jgi:hypothetical protein